MNIHPSIRFLQQAYIEKIYLIPFWNMQVLNKLLFYLNVLDLHRNGLSVNSGYTDYIFAFWKNDQHVLHVAMIMVCQI